MMNISLRNITAEDTENIIKWRNNPIVLQNFIDQTLLTREIHLYWLKNKIETGMVIQMIISLQETNADIGSVFLRDINYTHKKAEFGIFIGEDYGRGKGYGTEATKLMLNYAFSVLKLHKVYLRVFADNDKAIQVYKHVGFNSIGIFKDDVFISGTYRNVLFMEILHNNTVSL